MITGPACKWQLDVHRGESMKKLLILAGLAPWLLTTACAPSRSYSHYDMGRMLLAENKVDGAIEEFKKSLAVDPVDPTVHEALASLYFDKGYKDLAIDQWNKALEYSSENPGDFQPGPDGKKRSSQWIDDGIAARKRALEGLQSALNARAMDNYKLKKYEEALADWKAVTEMNALNKEAWEGLGYSYKKLKQGENSYAAWSEVIRLDKKDSKAAKNHGYAAFALGKIKEAEKSFTRFIELEPDNHLGYNNLGTVMSEQRRFGLAMDQFNRALQIKPNFVEALNGIATAHYYKKEYQKARDVWGKVLDLEPENPTAKENIRTLVRMGY